MKRVLMVFLKEPRPGMVKTRLARSVGPQAAAELYRILAEEEVRRTVPREGEYERLFFYAPRGAAAALTAWFPGETYVPQVDGDLGRRMAQAFATAFEGGAERVAIIGSDVPWVSRDHVLQAFELLDEHAVALGPTTDGGYYLLALGHPRPELFDGVAWSTPEVLPETLERAAARGWPVGQLERLSDVDTLDDVRREWRRLRPLLAGLTPERRAAWERYVSPGRCASS